MLRKQTFSTTFTPLEREILGTVAANLADRLIARAQSTPRDELAELTGMVSGPSQAPEDPGLKRLFPDFEAAGTEEVEGENSLLRQLHEPDILRAKLDQLRSIVEHLGPDGSVNVSLTAKEASLWVAALNDIRLQVHANEHPDAIGGPTGSGADDDFGADEAAFEQIGDDPEHMSDVDALVEWLGYCQDTLLTAMMGD